MKRLSREQLAQILRQRDRRACRAKRFAKRYARSVRKSPKRAPAARIRWRDIAVPVRLRYHGHKSFRDSFSTFVDDVQTVLQREGLVRLDFRRTEVLSPCGMLLLLGHLETWLAEHPNQLSARYPSNDLVEQMLQSANVLQRLGLQPRKEITHTDVIRWHRFEGSQVDATPLETFMEDVRDVAGMKLQMALGDCVSEAMTNVKKHAYPASSQSQGWWMFATIDREKGRVFVAMHDRGDSIPGTLLAKPELKDFLTLRTLGLYGTDRELIAAAVGGRTRTKLPYRGKGLPEMLDFTRLASENDLAIYSRRGYFAHRQADGREHKGNLRRPISGTLIIWTLNFPVQK